MSITSPIWPIIAAVLATLVFVALVVGWPRFTRRWARILRRGVSALVLNGLVVALCFLLLNNDFLFYSSWKDALGITGKPTEVATGVSAQTAMDARVDGSGLGAAPTTTDYALPQPGQRLQSYSVRDKASGTTMKVLVELPAGYSPTSAEKYPVIMGYHGYPSSPKAFTRVNFLDQIDAMESAGTLHKSIVVIPQINNPNTLDTECVNGGPGEPQTETWLAKELPHWTLQHFHVRTDRQSWATLGYSFGGWCAADIGMRHADIFGGVISFEGYFKPDFAKNYQPLTRQEWHSHDLIDLERRNPPPVAVWAFAAKQDKLAYPSTEELSQIARMPTSVTTTLIPIGGHRNSVFEPYTADALTWLAASLPGFNPNSK